MLLQIPVLIALYSVLRFPQHPSHLPAGSTLQTKINNAVVNTSHPTNPASFAGMNLLCNAQQAGTEAKLKDTQLHETISLDCGHGVPVRIPYYVLGLLMVGTMYYQQRQMQRAAPPGANAQQQALGRILPLISIFWGFIVPSGVILYWTTSNLVQIGQQHFLLRAGHLREPIFDHEKAGDGKSGDGKAGDGRGGQAPARRSATPAPSARRGFFSSMLERAESERAKRQGQGGTPARSSRGTSAQAGGTPKREQSSPSPSQQQRPSGGGGNARSRKKRRKR